MQERHENSLLKSEMDKLREENQNMRETIKKACCPKCGYATASKDAVMTAEEQQLRLENARLRAEIEKLRGKSGNLHEGTASPSFSCSAGTDQSSRTNMATYTGCFGMEKSEIMETVNLALNELIKMATAHEPLWIRSVETGREILNYDEYLLAFASETTRKSSDQAKLLVEASRDTGMVFLDMPRLVHAFVDAV